MFLYDLITFHTTERLCRDLKVGRSHDMIYCAEVQIEGFSRHITKEESVYL